ncbi:GGDEF domain-containing protein [Paenibacillus taichungensis]|uniref:GGDEF domain-containing protein n=1 Tax=Paenibacillus taichungensis TaxID=484184 RepID=UPI0035DFFD8A
MNLFFETLTFAILLIFASLSYLLYLRWNTNSYRIISVAAGVTAFVTLVSLIIHQVGTGIYIRIGMGAHIRTGILTLSIVCTSILYTGLFHFLQSKRKKELNLLLIASGVVILIGGVSWMFKLFILVPVIGLAFAAFYLFRYVPLMPRKKYFYVAIGANSISFIAFAIQASSANAFFLNLTLASNLIFCFVMLLIFFNRIADLIQAASHQSITDGLTKLYYKTYFKSRVQEAMSGSVQPAVIFADIDDFKKLNDTEGHLVGDKILRLVGDIWNEICSNDIGIAARYGGEETVALITSPQVDPRNIAERFRARVEEESKSIQPVTVSVGIAFFKNDVETAELFIKQADDAMYVAKGTGKNRIVEYGMDIPEEIIPTVHQESPEKISIESKVEPEYTEFKNTEAAEGDNPIFNQDLLEIDDSHVVDSTLPDPKVVLEPVPVNFAETEVLDQTADATKTVITDTDPNEVLINSDVSLQEGSEHSEQPQEGSQQEEPKRKISLFRDLATKNKEG